jgi:hypothetical protein
MHFPGVAAILLFVGGASAKSSASRWINTWTGMPQLTEFNNLPNPPFVRTLSLAFLNEPESLAERYNECILQFHHPPNAAHVHRGLGHPRPIL